MNRQLLEATRPFPKLNGYRAWHRNCWLLLAAGKLNAQTLLLFQFLIDQADFDTSHRNFGLVEVNPKQIGVIFNKKSLSTVRSWINKLAAMRFILKTDVPKVFRIPNLARYISPGFSNGKAAEYAKAEKNQSVEQIVEKIIIEPQSVDQNTQLTDIIGDHSSRDVYSRAIGSSKVHSGLSQSSFGEDDIDWINAHTPKDI